MATKIRKAKPATASAGRIGKPRNAIKLSRPTKKLPEAVGTVRDLRERFGLTRKLFSRMVGASERAVADWEGSKPPKGAYLQRMKEMERFQDALSGVMHADYVGDWLTTPNEAFGELKPIEVIERGEIDRLWRMIYQLESGMPT